LLYIKVKEEIYKHRRNIKVKEILNFMELKLDDEKNALTEE